MKFPQVFFFVYFCIFREILWKGCFFKEAEERALCLRAGGEEMVLDAVLWILVLLQEILRPSIIITSVYLIPNPVTDSVFTFISTINQDKLKI